MPYIKQEDRQFLDDVIEPLIEHIRGGFKVSPGGFNYLISRLFWTYFESHKSYSTANELIGVLECIKLEMYRRKIVDYEKQKSVENGDIK